MYPGITKPKDPNTPVTSGGSVSVGATGVTPYIAPGSGGTGNITPGGGGTGGGGGLNFAGVDPASSRTGLQAQTSLQGLIGRPLTPQELQQSMTLSGYTDQTGASPMTGAQYNLLLQEAARRTPGANFTAWSAPGATNTTTTTSQLNTAPAPGFNAPDLNLPTYNAPAKFGGLTWDQAMANDPGIAGRINRGQNVLEHGAAAAGQLHSPNTLAGLINYNQEAAGNEYGKAYDRAMGQWQAGYGVDRDTFQTQYQTAMDQYNAQMAGAQLEYAPGLLTWQQQNRQGELGFDRAWQDYIYNRDDAYRRETRDQNRYDTRDFYERDDLWRRYLSAVQQGQYSANLGHE